MVQTLAFPMRLENSGLLRRQDRVQAVLDLLQVMARTPAGSWAGCPSFGLRDLFDSGRLRSDVNSIAMKRINDAFADLHILDFTVIDIVRELSAQRETDTYSIVLAAAGQSQTLTATISQQD